MADRVSANITIGGAVSSEQFLKLTELTASHDLSTDWDGPAFAADARVEGEPLRLYAPRNAVGHVRRSGAILLRSAHCLCPLVGSLSGPVSGPSVSCSTASSGRRIYSVDVDDHIVLHEQTIDQLGTMHAIRAYLKPAAFEVPPLAIVET